MLLLCRYQPLRVHKIKVYEIDYRNNIPPLKKDYFEFGNEESLRLIKHKTKKNLIDGIVNVSWRLWDKN